MDIPALERDQAIRSYIPGRGVPELLRDPKTGRIYKNPLKPYVKPFWLVTEPEEIVLTPNGVSEVIPMTIDNKGHLEIIGGFFQSQQPEGYSVKMMDAKTNELMMNRDVHISTIAAGGGCATNYSVFGPETAAGRMYRWPDSYWLQVTEKGRSINVKFWNQSSLQNTVRFTLYGFRWYHTLADQKLADEIQALWMERRHIRPFFYTTDEFIRLANGESREATIRLSDDVHAEWVKGTSVSTGHYKVRVEERTTRRTFMTERLRDEMVFGPGELPFHMWESAVFEPNTRLVLDLENDFPGDNTIWVTLGCRHLKLSEATQ